MVRVIIQRNENPSHPGYINEYYDSIIASCNTIFQKPDNIYLMFSQKHTGINKHSEQRYYRWETLSTFGIRRNHNGNIVAYCIHKKKNSSPASTWAYLNRNETFRYHVESLFGISSWVDVYPVAKHYNLETYYDVPSTIISAMRATNSREFVERVFGKKQYRKDLLKATGSVRNMYLLHVAQAFRGLVPVDWIVNFMRLEHELPEYTPIVGKNLRNFLTQVDPRSYRHLLNQPLMFETPHELEDAMRLHNGVMNEDNYYRSWEDIHDRYMPRYTNFRATPFQDSEISLHPLAEKVHGLVTKSFEIQTATHTSQLTEWGQAMHNCIGGYRSMAVNKQTILGAVYSNSKLIANFELAPNGQLRQLLGPCNKSLPQSSRAEIESAFKSKGVNVQGYWGRE